MLLQAPSGAGRYVPQHVDGEMGGSVSSRSRHSRYPLHWPYRSSLSRPVRTLARGRSQTRSCPALPPASPGGSRFDAAEEPPWRSPQWLQHKEAMRASWGEWGPNLEALRVPDPWAVAVQDELQDASRRKQALYDSRVRRVTVLIPALRRAHGLKSPSHAHHRHRLGSGEMFDPAESDHSASTGSIPVILISDLKRLFGEYAGEVDEVEEEMPTVVHLSAEEQEILQLAFGMYDWDGSLDVSYPDLREILGFLERIPARQAPEEIVHLVNLMLDNQVPSVCNDPEGITYPEFIALVEGFYEELYGCLYEAYAAEGPFGKKELGQVLVDMGETEDVGDALDFLRTEDIVLGAEVSWQDFITVMCRWRGAKLAEYQRTGGFVGAELEELHTLFEKFCRGQSQLEIRQLLRLLLALERFPQNAEDNRKLLRMAVVTDADQTGNLDWGEFIHLMRCWVNSGVRGTKRLTQLQLDDFTHRMENFWASERMNMPLLLIELLRDYFHLRDTGKGVLSIWELLAVMEDLNFVESKEDQIVFRSLVAKLDEDDEVTAADFNQFVLVAQRYFQHSDRELWDKHLGPGVASVPKDQLDALLAASPMCKDDHRSEFVRVVTDFTKRPTVDFLFFGSCMKALRKRVAMLFKRYAGYSPEQIEEHKASFKVYDVDGSGTVSQKELVQVFADRKMLPRTNREREELMSMIRRVDTEGDGELTFQQYVRLVRTIENEQKRRIWRQRVQWGQESGFSEQEVKELHDSFDLADADGGGLVSMPELKLLFRKIGTPLEGELLTKVEKWKAELHNKDGELDFEQYLKLMRRYIDSVTAEAAQAEAKAKATSK